MKKIVLVLFLSMFLYSFQNQKIENLMGEDEFQTYNKLLDKIFTNEQMDIVEILTTLKNNGLLDLFFNKPRIIHTKFIFSPRNDIIKTKILNDSLKSLGYYYFYPSDTIKTDKNFILNIEFKSEHYIDPVLLIQEMKSRGCYVKDVDRENDVFSYIFDCEDSFIKEAVDLTNKNKRYINIKGNYWINPLEFTKIFIKTKKIDYWHPSVWFYDSKLNLINNIKINRKVVKLLLDIPPGCEYIKITDIYSAENFKRGIIVKGLK